MKRERIRGIVKLSHTHKTTEGALPMNKDNTNAFGKQRLEERFTLKHATPYGGTNLLWDYAESAVGLSRLFAKSLGFGKAGNAKYPLHQALTVLVLASAAGLGRIFNLADLEDDPLFLRKSGWRKLPKWRKPRRVVMIRYRPAETGADGQGKLFDDLDWQTAAMVTNLDWAEEDVWHFYNQRCAQENYIKEMKDGFGMDKIPSADFHPNFAMMLLKGIAYNLVLGLKQEIATGRFTRMTVARLRRELFWVAGKIVSHAGSLVLKLSADYRWQADYLCMRRTLKALAT